MENDFETIITRNNGGILKVHTLVGKNDSDYTQVLTVAMWFAQMGSDVKILPKFTSINEQYKKIYAGLIGTIYEGKCPDFSVNGTFYEVEGYNGNFSKTKLKNMIHRGIEQASRIIIDNTDGATDGLILRSIYSRIQSGKTIDEVWLYDNGKLRILYKKQ